MRGSRGRDVTIERCRRHAEAVCDLRHADIGIGEHCPRRFELVLCELRRAASGTAGPSRRREARLGALPDQAALEFRQRAKHVKNQPALRGRRVKSFGQAAKPDAPHPKNYGRK